MSVLLSGQDYAQDYLVPYLKATEQVFEQALRTLDKGASCRISPAADLCFPHDVVRIAGGFATGCLVEWDCRVPVVPIDTTVNIDITSLFELDQTVEARFTDAFFSELRTRIEADASYEWNLHKGNHFIAAVKRKSDGASGLILHSNEKEFKYQFNGLMPVPGNWFWQDVKLFESDGRCMRLLIGERATLFYRFAAMLNQYTVLRHVFFADQIKGSAKVLSEDHKLHYYMPHSQAVAIGCFLCDPGEVVPILSQPGRPISMFTPEVGGANSIKLLTGETKLLVPHGWGKTSSDPVDAAVQAGTFRINGMSFPIEPKATLGVHPGLVLREFSDDPASPCSLFQRMRSHCPGTVQDEWRQLAWYNKSGVIKV